MLFGELKRLVAAKAHDPQQIAISEALYEQFINDAVDDLKSSGWLVPIEEDETTLMVANTYSYAVPADFAYINRLFEEDYGVPGLYDYDIPDNAWRIGYDGGVPTIIFNSLCWTPTAGSHIKIKGQKRPPKYTTDAAVVEDGFVGFLRARAEAYALMYLAAVPIEEATPEILERRVAIVNARIAMANVLLMDSERKLARHPQEYRCKPDSRHCPTR